METKRLILREIEEKDCFDIYEYSKLESVCEMTQDQQHECIEDVLKSIQIFHIQHQKMYSLPTQVLQLKSNNKVIGLITLHQFNEIGFELNPKFHFQGYMFEALQCYLNYLKLFGLQKINAKVLTQNYVSIKLLKKLNFKKIKQKNEIIYFERSFYE